MKKARKAHLWIGLIASAFIFVEALTGLLMNEPWLIGQTGRGSFAGEQALSGNFQPGQFNQAQNAGNQTAAESGQTNGNNGQFRTQNGFGDNANFNRIERNQSSLTGIIRGLHEGRIGNTNIKWLVDLVAIMMILLTGTGIYLSFKILSAERKKKNRTTGNPTTV